MKLLKKLLVFVAIGVALVFFIEPIFRVEALTNFHSFTGAAQSDGATPYGSLVQGDDQLLYGTTKDGGANDLGTVFSYDPSNNLYTVLYNFGDEGDGTHPTGSLYNDGGTLYGLTSDGGDHTNHGVLFSYDTVQGVYTRLLYFDGVTQGLYPYGGLTKIGDTLYGMTREGGENNLGTLFSYKIGDVGTQLFSFDNKNTGFYPEGDLLVVNGDTLYGMTTEGGEYNKGTLFAFSTSDSKYNKHADFGYDEADTLALHRGEHPHGSLIAIDGVLYGMTSDGGPGIFGTIFSFNPDGDVFQTLHSFEGSDGGHPHGSLIAIDGVLYGMTSDGGANNLGTIFSYDVLADSFETISSFDGISGATPRGSLIQASDESLYGLTSEGGEHLLDTPSINLGTIFSLLVPHKTPAQFGFTSQTNVPKNTDIVSNEITIDGINTPIPISIVGCTSVCSYTGGTDGYANQGDVITLTIKSGSNCGVDNSATLYVGTVYASFVVSTNLCGGGGGAGPTLTQVTGVATPTSNQTPGYTFSTDAAGTIIYGGSCSSATTSAASGQNSITFNSLAEGTYSNCTIRVKDIFDDTSAPLAVDTFVVDLTAPVVSFSMQSTSSSLTVPITFSATDTVGVTGYKLTTSNTPPSSGWEDTPPTQYTFSSYGTKTLYAWAKDAAGNVSGESSDTIVLTESAPPPDTQQNTDSQGNTSSGGGSVPLSSILTTETKPKEAVVPTQPKTIDSTPIQERLKVVSTAVDTVLDSPVKRTIQRHFTPQQVVTIEISIKAIIASVATVGAAIVLASVLFLNPLASPEFILIPIRLWGLLITALGIRKKPVPWGIVYDSITKQPIDPVRVSLVDIEGHIVESSITDSSGRYGFAAKPGIYKVVLTKTNYLFPSHVIAQNDMRDELYEKPYFGDYLPYDPAAPIIKNIPLDPIDFDTAAFAQKNGDLSFHYSKREFIAGQVFTTLFLTTFLIITASLVVYPEKYNAIIWILYIAAFVLRRHHKRIKQMGRIYDLYGKPLAHVVMKVYSAIDNALIKTIKTTRNGRYYLHLPKGVYHIRIERMTSDGIYTPVYDSPELLVQYGIVNKVFNIAYS